MPFKEGNTKGKGRPKGSVNKDNELKAFIKGLISDNTDKLTKEIAKLEGKVYIDSVLALMEYAVPKLARVEVEGEIDATLFTIGFGETKKD
jgi:hypothetical protein